MSQQTNFQTIGADAVRQANLIAPGNPYLQQALVLGNILPRMIVPALKQVSGYEQQPRVYTHSAPMTTAAATGSTANATINWTANADFLWTTLSVISGVEGSSAFNFDMQITFGGNDRQMINRGVGVHPFALMGTYREPFLLPKAFVLRKRDTVQITITTLNATAVANCLVYFIGIDYMDANVLDGTRRVL